MNKKAIAFKCAKAGFIGLVLLFLYAPILLLAVYSFNATDMIGSWEEMSFKHYAKLFGDHVIMYMIGNTILLTFAVAFLSTLLVT